MRVTEKADSRGEEKTVFQNGKLTPWLKESENGASCKHQGKITTTMSQLFFFFILFPWNTGGGGGGYWWTEMIWVSTMMYNEIAERDSPQWRAFWKLSFQPWKLSYVLSAPPHVPCIWLSPAFHTVMHMCGLIIFCSLYRSPVVFLRFPPFPSLVKNPPHLKIPIWCGVQKHS